MVEWVRQRENSEIPLVIVCISETHFLYPPEGVFKKPEREQRYGLSLPVLSMYASSGLYSLLETLGYPSRM